MVPPLLLTIVLYMVPGILALAAIGMRGIRVVYPAPMVSTALVAFLAVVYGKARIGFTLTNIGLGILACIVLLLVIRLLARLLPRPPRGDDPRGAARNGRARIPRIAVAYSVGFLLSIAVWVLEYARPMRGPDNFPQPYDTPFHFSVIAHIVESGNGSTLTSAMVDRTAGSTLYPAAWHDMVALVVQTTGTSIPVAVAASCTTILVLVWPLAILGLSCELLGHRGRWVLLSLGLSGLFAAFPYHFVVYGVLYSNFLSYALLPSFIGLFAGHLTRLRVPPREHLAMVVVLLVGLVGVGLAQPNSAFTIVVIALPLLVQQIFRWSGADVRERRGLVLPTAISVALVLCIAAVWRFLYARPALHRTVSFEWPPFQTDAQAIGVYAAFGVNDRGPAQYVLCALVFAGIVRALHRRLHWLVASWGLVGVLYVLTSSTTSTFRDVLTGFWYHDSNRLLAASPIMAVPLACLGIAWLCARARSLSSRLPQAGMGLEAVAVVLVAGLTCAGGGLTSQRALLRGESVPSQQTGLQDDEYAFLERVSQVVPQGTGVANYPYDGSAYAYSLFHVNVFFRDYDANWIGQPTSDIDTVRHDLNRAADSPATCEVLRTYDIEYALVMDRNALNGTQAPDLPFIGVDEGNWSGLTVDEGTPGFELVLNDGRGNSLYRITACQG